MPYHIQISPSGRARCCECGERIAKDTKRLVIPNGEYNGYTKYKYGCQKCAPHMIEDDIDTLLSLKKEMKRI